MSQALSISHAYCVKNHNRGMLVYDPKKIIALREAKGWNQAELARRSELSQPTVWSLEHGETIMVKFETLEAVAGALGVPLGDILAIKPKGKRGEGWQQEIQAAYDALDDDGKATIIAVAQTLLNKKRR